MPNVAGGVPSARQPRPLEKSSHARIAYWLEEQMEHDRNARSTDESANESGGDTCALWPTGRPRPRRS